MSQHRVILGTHTSGQAQNYLQIAHCEIPDFRVPDLSELNEERGEIGGHGHAKRPFDFKIAQKINHPGEVNKARYQPQNPDIIASLCVDGKVLIFDRTKHPLQPKDDTIKFEAELVGHNKEGFGLSWSPLSEGHLVTGNEDTTVKTWDIKTGFSKSNKTISPTATYTVHSCHCERCPIPPYPQLPYRHRIRRFDLANYRYPYAITQKGSLPKGSTRRCRQLRFVPPRIRDDHGHGLGRQDYWHLGSAKL